jgi:hypothetical protein
VLFYRHPQVEAVVLGRIALDVSKFGNRFYPQIFPCNDQPVPVPALGKVLIGKTAADIFRLRLRLAEDDILISP